MVPLSHTLFRTLHPFQLLLNARFFKYESITKIERYLRTLSHKIYLLALLGPFTDPNDRFPYCNYLPKRERYIIIPFVYCLFVASVLQLLFSSNLQKA